MKRMAWLAMVLGTAACQQQAGVTGVGMLCVEESPTRLVKLSLVGVCADLEPQEALNGVSAGGGTTVVEDGVPHRFQEVDVDVWKHRRHGDCTGDVVEIGFPLNDQFGFHHWQYGPDQQLDFFIDDQGELKDVEGERRTRICADSTMVDVLDPADTALD